MWDLLCEKIVFSIKGVKGKICGVFWAQGKTSLYKTLWTCEIMFHNTVISGSHSNTVMFTVRCIPKGGSDRRHLVHYKSSWHSQQGWRLPLSTPYYKPFFLPLSTLSLQPLFSLSLCLWDHVSLSSTCKSSWDGLTVYTLQSTESSSFNCSLSLWALSLQSTSHLRVQVLSWLYYPAHNTPCKVNLSDIGCTILPLKSINSITSPALKLYIWEAS